MADFTIPDDGRRGPFLVVLPVFLLVSGSAAGDGYSFVLACEPGGPTLLLFTEFDLAGQAIARLGLGDAFPYRLGQPASLRKVLARAYTSGWATHAAIDTDPRHRAAGRVCPIPDLLALLSRADR